MGRYDLGLTDEEFWRLDPERLNALRARWAADQRRQDARAALVAMMLANIYRDLDERANPFTIDELALQLALLPEELDVEPIITAARVAERSKIADLLALVPEKES